MEAAKVFFPGKQQSSPVDAQPATAYAPGHGLPEVGHFASNTAELGGHQDEVRVISVDEVIELLCPYSRDNDDKDRSSITF